MLNVYNVPLEDVQTIEWVGNFAEFNSTLYALGKGHKKFLIPHPEVLDLDVYKFITYIPPGMTIWKIQDRCIAVTFTKNWKWSDGNSEISIDISSHLIWEKNPAFDFIPIENDPSQNPTMDMDLYDLRYQMTWYLDPEFDKNAEKIWVLKCHLADTVTQGSKDMGNLTIKADEIVFKKTINPSIPKLEYKIDYDIPWYDYQYEHIWLLDKSLHDHKDDVWAVKVSPLKVSTGTKLIGSINATYELPDKLDVIFISYGEVNAEQNWQRVLEKAPWAKRVDMVEGIFNAHREAAGLSTTDSFYVVDGDAWLVDEWNFDFQPRILDRETTHIWQSKNPVNQSVYGYGGVKLFCKRIIEATSKWTTLDMTTTITAKIKSLEGISNVTAFDTDEFSVWRSSFRECVKLCYNIKKNPMDVLSKTRLRQWRNPDAEHKFGAISEEAANAAVEWSQTNEYNLETLKLINSREWLQETFNNR